MKIGIVVGSIREGRIGESVANWVAETARKYVAEQDSQNAENAQFDIVDLKSFNVPLLTDPTVPGAAGGKYASPEVQAWADAISSYDAFIFVTPEYNHGVPGAFKNAVDSIFPEWWGKRVGFVGYGAAGGVRAVEQWRQIVGNFNMFDVRQQLEISIFNEFDESGYKPGERRADELGTMLGQLLA